MEAVFECQLCQLEFPTEKGFNIHKTKKHRPILNNDVPGRPRKRRTHRDRHVHGTTIGGLEQVADFTDEHEIEGNLAVEMDMASHGDPEDYVLNAGVNGGEDFDVEGVSETVTAYPSDVYEDQQTLERMSVEESSLSGTFNPFPDWSDLNSAAHVLALFGPVPPLDLVASGHLSVEESKLSLWGQVYNISVAALDKLQLTLSALDHNGRPVFDVTNLVNTETQRRRVVDGLIPAHQRTARGDLFTRAVCDGYCGLTGVRLNAVHVRQLGRQHEAMPLLNRITTEYLNPTAAGECSAPHSLADDWSHEANTI